MDIVQQTLNVNGTHLYYERAGTGETLVLIHGGAGDRRYWDHQFPTLAAHFDVLRYDLRGYGRSAEPVEGLSYRHEDDLAGLLTALKIPKAHVAGYSLGCQVAVDAHTVYPELFRSIIAIGPFVSGHTSPACDALFGAYAECGATFCQHGPHAAAARFTSIAPFNPKHISRAIRDELVGICGEYTWWWANHDDPLEPVTPPAVTVLEKIGVPVLTITAEFDATACLEVADLLERQVPNIKRVDIADSTHFMLMEQPNDVNREIINFIGSVADEYRIVELK